MTPRIKAINRYRPRLNLAKTVQHPELIRTMASGTGLMEGNVNHTVTDLRDKILLYCRLGHAVKVDGLGIWTPAIGLDGKISINYRPDPHFIFTINAPGMFNGKIVNSENIGLTVEELIDLWNRDNPDDPVILSGTASGDNGVSPVEAIDPHNPPPSAPPPM